MRVLVPAITFFAIGNSAINAAQPVDYVRQVKPLFAERCFRCHGPDVRKSDLRLDTAKAMLAGGKTGPAIVAGKGEKSVLVQALAGTSNTIVAMPPTGEGDPLSDEQIALIRRWIDEGAKAPGDEKPAEPRQPPKK